MKTEPLIVVEQFECMQKRMLILEGIARGEGAILENNVYTHEEAKKEMKKWLDLKA